MDYQPAAGALLDAGCAWAVVCSPGSLTPAAVKPGGYNKMRTAVALGSNLGDRLENLRAARRQITELAQVQPPVVSSAIYETEPVDCEPGASKFMNAVVEFDYEGDLAHLLEQLVHIEEALGRKRDHRENVSRTIDIDLLYCGDRQIDNERLQLPHPRMHRRKFVLQPLADIRPELVLANQRKTVRELLVELEESGELVRLTDDW
jgi:2-amino-4-hydroxy-6-hydroxymethyldihydropteridine diphosphokinase